MTSTIDIWNRALGEIGARVFVNSEDDTTPQGVYCRLNYNTLRRQLLRAAHWSFARKTGPLTLLGSQFVNPPTAPIPWLFKYEYPPDCLAMRYILPPPPAIQANTPVVGAQVFTPWCPPSRAFRYIPAYDDTVEPPLKILLTNVGWQGPTLYGGALGVYTVDTTNPDMWDDLFTDALVAMLANKLVVPLSGDLDMKKTWVALAQQAIIEARVVDGNEAIPSSDIRVDWIEARGFIPLSAYGTASGAYGFGGLGGWTDGYTNVNWGG